MGRHGSEGNWPPFVIPSLIGGKSSDWIMLSCQDSDMEMPANLSETSEDEGSVEIQAGWICPLFFIGIHDKLFFFFKSSVSEGPINLFHRQFSTMLEVA